MQDSSAQLEIYLPAGGGQANGEYVIGTDPWTVVDQIPSRGNITRSNVTLRGDGSFQTIVRQPAFNSGDPTSNLMFMAHVDPNATANVLTNITIRDMSLIGNLSGSNPGSYNQFNNLLQIAGVTNFTVSGVEFRDFMGDGIYTGSVRKDLLVHNANLVVQSCRFDGVSKKNRNAISMIDCDGWTVSGCAFLNCCDPARNTPGAIDIEPELRLSRVRNGTIYNCSFDNIGGNAVALLNGIRADCSGLKFSYCNIGNILKSVLTISYFNTVTATNLYCEGVTGTGYNGMGYAVTIDATDGVTIKDSTFRNADSMLIGGANAAPSRNVTIQNNGLFRCGNVNGPVIIQRATIDGVSVLNNQLIQCGVAGLVSPLYFVNNADAQNAKVLNLNVTGNVVQPVGSNITDIGRVLGGRFGELKPRLPNPTYSNVNRNGNTPSMISGGAENLDNVP